MAGMGPAMTLAKASNAESRDPLGPSFWFIISMALLVGFITAYPMNWWLVSRHMKHGMVTVRPPGERSAGMQEKGEIVMDHGTKPVSNILLAGMTILSLLILGLGLSIAIAFGGL